MPGRADRDRVAGAVDAALARSRADTDDPQAATWRRFEQLVESKAWRQAKDEERAAWANLVCLCVDAEAEDVLTLNTLIRTLGHEPLASVQDRLDELLGHGPDQPVLSGVLALLDREQAMCDALVDAGLDIEEATEVAELNHHHASWLILVGIGDPRPSRRQPWSDHLERLVESHSVADWRALVAPVALNPWGPAADRLVELARRTARDDVARAVQQFQVVYRERQEQREREHVALEIRRLVAISGLTQRDFAAYVGTSASRLSTYISGKVTPSAAMLLRIRRAAHALQEEKRA
ncbi:helix-turn-helix transcriptional regulator [Nocardioides sp. TF02-7]|uniref:helix-turn-helix domain-containing protein n=1 Tax=Nocardioides sp. TF02-7 TaxID=2917724 RepID=UPI001F05FC6A|nr:helix-turn-helix transcriptional regulator [Nocardioides sp. TF02-7]UMG91150.1 helix-turn-helix domain-containing protein [Nocardioides sp. TF02-7]